MKKNVPIYGINEFRNHSLSNLPFQAEEFDAYRHFNVEYPHRHDFFEILFITQGKGVHSIDENKYDITPPCLFFLSPGQTHDIKLSEDVKGYIFLFTSEFYLFDKRDKNRLLQLPYFFSPNKENPLILIQKEIDFQFFKSLFERACYLISKQEAYVVESMSAILETILSTANEFYSATNLKPSKNQLLTKKFLMLLEEKYQENLPISTYADLLKVSPDHLTFVIKETTGKTSLQVIKDKQIVEIKRFLLFTDLTISEITAELNFADHSYFSKFFKKETGESPTEFREKSRKNTQNIPN